MQLDAPGEHGVSLAADGYRLRDGWHPTLTLALAGAGTAAAATYLATRTGQHTSG